MPDSLNILLALPLLLGLLYAFSTICIKRAMMGGTDPFTVLLASCVASALCHLPLFFFAKPPAPGAQAWQLLIPTLGFFFGLLFNFLAVSKGDISLVAPVMGAKVLLVSLFTVVLLGHPVRLELWLGAVLVFLAVLLMRRSTHHRPGSFWPSFLLALASSAAFSVTDVLFQGWSGKWGVGILPPIVMIGSSLIAVAIWHSRNTEQRRIPRGMHGWLIAGSLLIGLQVVGMSICLTLLRDNNAATAVNIVFNSRGIWTVVLAWSSGRLFGIGEHLYGGKVMSLRLAGAILIMIAIFLVMGR